MAIDANFDKRTRRVVKKHERMNRRGVRHTVGRDGLIVARPRRRSLLPMRLILPIVLLGFAYKAYVYQELGTEGYEARVAALAEGNRVEQIGAVLMQPEPVTLFLAQKIAAIHAPVMRN